MDKIWLSASLVAIVAIIVAGATWQAAKNENLSPTNLETCKSLSYSGPNALNLLFFSSDKDAEVYSSYLLNHEPFSSSSNNFNVYYIDSYSPKCTFYKSIALFCHSKELTLKSASCPHDYVFVLKKESSSIRSSAYGIVGSINTGHPLTVLLHEFGHLFANFAEEYSPASLPAGQPNCKLKCSEFGEYSSSCFSECSDSIHRRSIENGVMRTLDSDKYGEYNNQVLKSIIDTLIANQDSKTTGLAVSTTESCQDSSQLVVDAHYSDGSLVIDSLSKAAGCAPENNIGPSTTSIYSGEQEYSSYNTPDYQNLFTDSPPPGGSGTIDGETFQPIDSFSFSIPFSQGTSLENKNSDGKSVIFSMSTIGATPCRIE